MASEVKTNKISPVGSTVTLGDASDVFQLPALAEIDIASGATLDVNGTIDLTGATKTGFPTGGFLGMVVYTGNGTYTPGNTDNGTAGDEGSASVTKIIVEVQGGGAGGVSGDGANIGSGSGAGGYAKQFISTLTTGAVVVGVAGTAGVVGGTSSFIDNSNTISCAGGAVGSVTVGGAGGAVTATGAFIKINGQNGEPAISSHGGSSGLGLGGANLTADAGNTTGHVGTGYGAGGSAGRGNYSTGGAGSIGIVIIAEYA